MPEFQGYKELNDHKLFTHHINSQQVLLILCDIAYVHDRRKILLTLEVEIRMSLFSVQVHGSLPG